MSSINEANVTHPMVTLYTNWIQQAQQHLEKGQMLKLVEVLIAVNASVKPVHSSDDLQAKLFREYHKLEQARTSRTEMYELNVVARPYYYKIFREVLETLHNGGYFSGEAYKELHDPSGGKKSQ